MNTTASHSSSSHGHRVLLLAILFGLLAMFVLFSAGCATVGRDFSVSKVSEIRIGETTQDDIRAMFGSPWRVGIEDGQRTWTYGKYRYRLFGEKIAQDLLIRFDERGVVASYTFNTTEHQE